jgi:hypothetical protein
VNETKRDGLFDEVIVPFALTDAISQVPRGFSPRKERIMEKEKQIPRMGGSGGGPGQGPDGVEVDLIHAETMGILDSADRVLSTIRPVNAEDYLQRNRQRGGQ